MEVEYRNGVFWGVSGFVVYQEEFYTWFEEKLLCIDGSELNMKGKAGRDYRIVKDCFGDYLDYGVQGQKKGI